MGIKLVNSNSVKKYIQKFGEVEVYNMIFERFNRVGLNFIRNARTTDTYQDQTSQLRNSIGYIVAYNGVIKAEDFETDGTNGIDSGLGRVNGLKYAIELSQGVKGFVLICVAGASYSAYVEDKGYDVITGSELKAINELERMFK